MIIAVAESNGGLSDSNIVYKQLEDALLDGETSSTPNLKVLERGFFPMRSPEPVCVPVQYSLICSSNSSNNTADTIFSEESDIETTVLNLTYLWTEYYISHTTGTLLFSFSQSGITLRGFEWEKSCIFMNTTEIVLELDSDSIDCSSKVVEDSLGDLTSQVSPRL